MSLIGLAIGDSLGLAFEGVKENTEAYKILQNWQGEFLGGNIAGMPHATNKIAGETSDDTGMATALAYSLNNIGYYLPEDVMESYLFYYTANEKDPNCVGGTIKKALESYKITKCWFGNNDINSYGNGTVMRVAPIGMFYTNPYTAMEIARIDAKLTHGSVTTQEASAAIAGVISFLRDGKDKHTAISLVAKALNESSIKHFMNNLDKDLASIKKELSECYSRRFNALDATILPLKMLKDYDSFEEIVINTIKLGYDTDTNGAIAGSMAGCIYKIDDKFINGLVQKNQILNLERCFNEHE